MKGKIIKGIAGFYYVNVVESGIYECKAKGIFRKEKRKPLVGDNVEIEVLDEEKKIGNLISIEERTSELIRPAVSNVDQALVIFAVKKPNPNFNLLDRFLLRMQMQKVPVVLCFNKADLATEEEKEEIRKIYEKSECPVFFISAREQKGLEELDACLEGKTTTVAGPSGVGKSTLINYLQSNVEMETGSISQKIDRGKHTTRHSELIAVRENTYIMDTPGFSSLELPVMEKEELPYLYPEFTDYEPYCKFQGCSHLHEPDCGVQEAVKDGEISTIRYENYRLFYEEIANRKKY